MQNYLSDWTQKLVNNFFQEDAQGMLDLLDNGDK